MLPYHAVLVSENNEFRQYKIKLAYERTGAFSGQLRALNSKLSNAGMDSFYCFLIFHRHNLARSHGALSEGREQMLSRILAQARERLLSFRATADDERKREIDDILKIFDVVSKYVLLFCFSVQPISQY
jgi:hypothetical protein